MAIDTKKFLIRFAEESRKHTARLREGILSLEQRPDDQEMLNTLFRCAHTIKGSASMMNLTEISEFAHLIENSLSRLRDGTRLFTKELADRLLEASDLLDLMVSLTEEGKDVSPPPQILVQLLESDTVPDGEEPAAAAVQQPSTGRQAYSIQAAKLDALLNLVGELSVSGHDTRGNTDKMEDLSRDIGALGVTVEKQNEILPESLTAQVHSLRERSIDLTEKMIQHSYSMDHLTEELRSLLISLRMIPISLITEQIPRLARDAAARMGKEAACIIRGVETELDKTIIDTVEEVLIQIVRNAVDHGIETPEARKQAGKPAHGTIIIDAGYERGMCRLSISDDGAGIPVGKLLTRAGEKHKISPEELASMGRNISPSQLVKLVTLPGLSSASLITDVSGRGVGMDIVSENIVRRLGGTLEIETKQGVGTTIIMWLPLNQAVMELLVVRIGSKQVALPVSAVEQVLRLRPEDFIKVAQRRAVRLEQQILPVASMHSVFREEEDEHPGFRLLLVVNSGNGQVVLLIDDIISQDQFVIQPLPEYLQRNSWVSGCVITGAYNIMNVLNTQKISEQIQEASAGSAIRTEVPAVKPITILVADDSVSTRDIEKNILESYGYLVELAADGEQAYDTAMEQQFDVVITDIEMPLMDGITLTRKLRSEKTYRHTPIILVTSRDREEDKKKGIEAGADAYIVKSAFDQDNLLKIIRTLTGT